MYGPVGPNLGTLETEVSDNFHPPIGSNGANTYPAEIPIANPPVDEEA